MPSDIPAHASQSILTIDLGAIAQNYRDLRLIHVTAGACAAVIKADAYGLGARRIAPVLYDAGCRAFYVAHLNEAIEVRSVLQGRDAAVCVLSGLIANEAAEFRRSGIVPVLNDLGQVESWSREARTSAKVLPAVVHIDTGMSRLGLGADETARLSAEPERLSGLDIHFWMSHLACADEADSPMNREQLGRLKAATGALPPAPVSLANSSGIFLGPEYHLDQSRPGCALYGINPVPGRSNPMRQVARLDAKVLQIRTIDHPQTVGYGATHRAAGPTRVATISVGYADGWLRSLSNRGFAVVNGVKVPFIGRVSMDLITIDVTSLPDLKPGDPVELMGNHLTADHVADLAGTIGYEVLTRLGARFHRRYISAPSGTA